MTELFTAAGKRWRVFVMAGTALFGFLRGMDGRAAYRLYGMPADTKLVATLASEKTPGAVVFLLESKEWEPLESNESEIPEVKFEILTALMPNRLEKPKQFQKAGGASRG